MNIKACISISALINGADDFFYVFIFSVIVFLLRLYHIFTAGALRLWSVREREKQGV